MNKISKFKLLIIVSFLALASLTYGLVTGPTFWFSSQMPKAAKQSVQADGLYKFTSLPEPLIARSGKYSLSFTEVESDPSVLALAEEYKELLVASVISQYGVGNTEKTHEVLFNFAAPQLSVPAIVNKYAIQGKIGKKIKFRRFDNPKTIALVNANKIKESDINKEGFLWSAFLTKAFHTKLDVIDRLLKNKIVTNESKKLNLRVQEYFASYADSYVPQAVSTAEVEKYLKNKGLGSDTFNRKLATKVLRRELKKKARDYVLEKYIMDLPIQVNLTPPTIKLETNHEWTPAFGDSDGLEVVIFSETRNSQNAALLQGLIAEISKMENVQFFYRPIVKSQNYLQSLTTQAHFCVLVSRPDKFWQYFVNTLGDFKDQTETTLYNQAQEVGLPTDSLRKCILEKRFEEIVTYHEKYADYLGIQNGPVIYVGGEVLHGAITSEKVMAIVRRKLGLAKVGEW